MSDHTDADRLLSEQAARIARGNQEAGPLLREASGEVLLRAFAALTHRLHAADRTKGEERPTLVLSLRTQRNLVEDEILRRVRQ